jgi:hypothetical protein
MLLALGAASAALDALTSLVSPKPSPSQRTTGFGQTAPTPFDIASTTDSTSSAPMSGFAGPSQGGLSPATMSALLQAQGQSSAAASTPISQSDALKNLFSQLDADGDGSVTLDKMSSSLKGAGGHRHHHHHHATAPSTTSGVSTSAASAYSAIEARQQDAKALSASPASSLSVSV